MPVGVLRPVQNVSRVSPRGPRPGNRLRHPAALHHRAGPSHRHRLHQRKCRLHLHRSSLSTLIHKRWARLRRQTVFSPSLCDAIYERRPIAYTIFYATSLTILIAMLAGAAE